MFSKPYRADEWNREVKWNKFEEMFKKEDLDPEVKLYCTWDVEPLHEMYNIFKVIIIEPDYDAKVREISENDLITSVCSIIDSKEHKQDQEKIHSCGLFLTYLEKRVKKT